MEGSSVNGTLVRGEEKGVRCETQRTRTKTKQPGKAADTYAFLHIAKRKNARLSTWDDVRTGDNVN
jgi:hypothetical protein